MSPQDLKLDQLVATYEIIGELSGGSDVSRIFMARRKADGLDVVIAVTHTPPGDEGNALSHLAADANLLSGHMHRCLLPVIEGRWLDTETFASVTERVSAPSLEELLARRDEEFTYPRIATILREVNGALEWARGQRVVHRTIELCHVYVEPGSDRVLLSLSVRPLPLADMPDAEEDARTIAALARAMLTRSVADPERESRPLRELRPGLPAQVIEHTEELLATRASGKKADVMGYIAAIAMADFVKRGEAESERLFQVERDALAKERAALEKDREALGSEREAIEKERNPRRRTAPIVRLSAAAAVLVLLIAISVFAPTGRKRSASEIDSSAPASVRPIEFASGAVAERLTPAGPPAGIPTDLIEGVAARAAAASANRVATRRRRPLLPTDTLRRIDSTLRRDSVQRDTLIRRDTLRSRS